MNGARNLVNVYFCAQSAKWTGNGMNKRGILDFSDDARIIEGAIVCLRHRAARRGNEELPGLCHAAGRSIKCLSRNERNGRGRRQKSGETKGFSAFVSCRARRVRRRPTAFSWFFTASVIQ
ncbi:MAG: hypothetical protein LBI87_13025 [Candidatus Accumulibacter sp.]|nr:hypothetical protein [Accumulibacter sp.]